MNFTSMTRSTHTARSADTRCDILPWQTRTRQSRTLTEVEYARAQNDVCLKHSFIMSAES
jgi:hypothetical protein